MIKKTYYLGQCKSGSQFAGFYFVGIHRDGSGTVPLCVTSVNGVFNDVSARMIREPEFLKGYLSALVSEFKFEGPEEGDHFFDITFKNWNEHSEKLFKRYMEDIPNLTGNVLPLQQIQIRNLEHIVGLHIKSD